MKLRPISVAIRVLCDSPLPPRTSSVSKKQAIEWLGEVSGEDFGNDATAWREWLRKNRWGYFRFPSHRRSNVTKSR